MFQGVPWVAGCNVEYKQQGDFFSLLMFMNFKVNFESMTQQQIDQYKEDHQKKYESMDADDKKQYNFKKRVRTFGNVSFVAELIKQKVFPSKTHLYISTNLINIFTDNYIKFHHKKTLKSATNIEDNLEALLKFYEQAGNFISNREKQKPIEDQEIKQKLRRHYIQRFKNGSKIDAKLQGTAKGLHINEFYTFLKKLRKYKYVTPKLDALIHNFLDFKETWTKFGSEMVPQKLRDLDKNWYRQKRQQLETKVHCHRSSRYRKKNKVESSSTESEDEEIQSGDEQVNDDLFKGPDYECSDITATDKTQTPKLNVIKAKERIEVIFKYLLESTYTEANLIKDLSEFCIVHHPTRLIKTFFLHVHDGKILDCLPRLQIPCLLVEYNGLEKEVLKTVFLHHVKKNFLEDLPGLKKYYGHLVREFCLVKQLFTLEELCSGIKLGNDEDNEDFYEMQDFWEKIFKFFIGYSMEHENFNKELVGKILKEQLKLDKPEKVLEKALEKPAKF